MGHKNGKRPVRTKTRAPRIVTHTRVASDARLQCDALLGYSATATKAAQVVCEEYVTAGKGDSRIERSVGTARDRIRREFSSLELLNVSAIDKGIDTAAKQLKAVIRERNGRVA